MEKTETNEVIKNLQATLNMLIKQQELEERDSLIEQHEIYKRDKTKLITCKEAAKLYPIGEQKFRELCRSTNKKFPSISVGCRYYIVKNKLDEWFRENAIGESF